MAKQSVGEVSVQDLPSLAALDLTRLKPLRGTNHAKLKNDLMMHFLMRMPWFVEYRRELKAYRTGGGSVPMPTYPTNKVESVERIVDALIVAKVDPEYQR